MKQIEIAKRVKYKSTKYALSYGAGNKKAFALFKSENKRIPARALKTSFKCIKMWYERSGILAEDFSKLPDGTAFVDYHGIRWIKVNEADEYNAVLMSDSNIGGLFKEDYLCRVKIK